MSISPGAFAGRHEHQEAREPGDGRSTREAANDAAEGAPLRLAEVERLHIRRVMTESGGNVSRAARVLGLHRRSLQRKLARDKAIP